MHSLRRTTGISLTLLALAAIMVGCAPTALQPAQIQTANVNYVSFTGPSCSDSGSTIPRQPATSADALVGKDIATRSIPYNLTKGFEQCQTTWFFYESTIRFNTQRLAQTTFAHAVLTFRVLGGSDISCATRLDLATAAVSQTSGNLPSSERYLALPSGRLGSARAGSGVSIDARTASVSADVTTAVKDWATHRRANDGFVLLGPTLDDGNAPACVSDYGDFTLALTAW
jgi:hypothetical protein